MITLPALPSRDFTGASYSFVCFPAQMNGLRQPWYLRRLHPAWRHCLLLRYAGPDCTLIAEHLGSYARVEFLNVSIGQCARNLQEQHGALILLVDETRPPPKAMMRGPMSCVEFVKALLGIGRPWIVTPHQLYRHLRRAGASHVFPTVNS
jgi:hypothetical protein